MLSKRRAIALDKSSVKKKLSLPCRCAKNCQKQFSVNEILYWRQRIHCIPAGEERIKKLAEMIQLCAITIRKYERDSVYRINQKLCCRWVLFTAFVIQLKVRLRNRILYSICILYIFKTFLHGDCAWHIHTNTYKSQTSYSRKPI